MTESVSLRETPEREQITIRQHQMMGWKLKSSQEINTSTTSVSEINGTVSSSVSKENYVKLVFERETDLPNYAMLQRGYAAWTALREQYLAKLHVNPDTLLSKKQKRTCYLVASIIAVILFVITLPLTLLLGIGLGIFLSLGAGAMGFAIVMAIMTGTMESKAKKRPQPELLQLLRQMESVAQDAAKYL